MNRWLAGRVLFPLHERVKGKPTFPWLGRLEKTQWLDPARLAELQWERLREHVRFAHAHVPYYRRLLDEHGVAPDRLRGPDDFRRIPYLTRDLLRSRFDDLTARADVGKVTRRTSGGSTGEPAIVLVDMNRMGFGEAVRLRAHRWYGLEPGAREVCVWGSPIELTRQDRLRAARDWVLNSRVVSAFQMSEAEMAAYGRVISSFRPDKIMAYAHAMYVLTQHLSQTGWTPPRGLKAIFTTAEMLFDFQRDAITRTFGVPVGIEYGARDAGLLAYECPQRGLHIAAEGVVLEIDGAGPDGLGEIVVTNLYSAAMPIIRYRTGDMGQLDPDPCPCGRTLPRLRRLEGRRIDFLVTPDGRIMHPQAVVFILRDVHPIREFQIVQEDIERLRILIVPSDGFSEATRRAILAKVERVMGARVVVDIELTDAIARAPSGKHRFVISKIADRHLDGLGIHASGTGAEETVRGAR
jgi:phenylacetate-CoA ligase